MTMKTTTIRTLTLILVTTLALVSGSAEARGFFGPRVGIGLGFGYPYYGWYDPWFHSPFYGYAYPYGAYRAPVPQEERAPENLYAYPEKGQSSEQTAQDRNECKAWAVEESGLDPATAKRREKNQKMDDYNRAFMACMEGRDYTVK
jgi:hypothetical protein